MFELNRAIDDWCREVIAQNCARQSKFDELKDHLHCLVEDEMTRGADAQEAFVAAIRQMGDSTLISREYSKNRSLLEKVAAFDRSLPNRLQQRFSVRQRVAMMLGVSVFFAILIIAVTRMTQDPTWEYWLLALWLVPFTIFASMPDVRQAECTWLRRVVRRRS